MSRSCRELCRSRFKFFLHSKEDFLHFRQCKKASFQSVATVFQTVSEVENRWSTSWCFSSFLLALKLFKTRSAHNGPVYYVKPFLVVSCELWQANLRFCYLMPSDMKKEGETKSINYLSSFFSSKRQFRILGQSRKSKNNFGREKSQDENLIVRPRWTQKGVLSKKRTARKLVYCRNHKKVTIELVRYGFVPTIKASSLLIVNCPLLWRLLLKKH